MGPGGVCPELLSGGSETTPGTPAQGTSPLPLMRGAFPFVPALPPFIEHLLLQGTELKAGPMGVGTEDCDFAGCSMWGLGG